MKIISTLTKFKIASFVSYNFIVHYQDIYENEEQYIIPLSVEPTTALEYWHVMLTVSKTADIESEIQSAFQYIYQAFPYPIKSSFKNVNKGKVSKKVHFKLNADYPKHKISTDIPEVIQETLTDKYSLFLKHTLKDLKDPRDTESPTFQLYKMEKSFMF